MINPNTKRNLLKIAVFGAVIYGAYNVVNGISKKQKVETIEETRSDILAKILEAFLLTIS